MKVVVQCAVAAVPNYLPPQRTLINLIVALGHRKLPRADFFFHRRVNLPITPVSFSSQPHYAAKAPKTVIDEPTRP